MKNICPCLIERLKGNAHYSVWASIHLGPKSYDYIQSQADKAQNLVEEILESDCVCEKKEEKLDTWVKRASYIVREIEKKMENDPSLAEGLALHLAISKGNLKKALEYEKEKQSQSPCEHDWLHTFEFPAVNNNGLSQKVQLWFCAKGKCGLVTCNNPNDK